MGSRLFSKKGVVIVVNIVVFLMWSLFFKSSLVFVQIGWPRRDEEVNRLSEQK